MNDTDKEGNMVSRRLTTVAAATLAVWMMLAGTALAHFCYVPNRSDQGNQAAAKSKAWVSIDHILTEEIGLCEEGAAHFEEVFLAPRGVSRATLLHDRALLAAPHVFTEKMQDGKGIDHLFVSEEDFVELDAAIDEAFGVCFAP